VFTKATGAAPVTQALPNATGFTNDVCAYIMATAVNENAVTDFVARNYLISIGAYSQQGTASQWNCSISSELNANQADQKSDNDEVLYQIGLGASLDATATPQTITDTQPDVEWNPNTGTAVQIGYIAFEEDPTFHLAGTTRDEAGATLGNCRCILMKHDGAAEATRIYTKIAEINSNGSGAYDFLGLLDTDARYMVISLDIATPIVRGVTNDTLAPVL